MTIRVQVATPMGIVWQGDAQTVVLPGVDGNIGILSGHMPLTAYLTIGIVRVCINQQWLVLFVQEGFAQVEGDRVVVLTNAAEWGSQIDINLAAVALGVAENSMQHSQTKGERFLADRAIKMAKNRLKAAQEWSRIQPRYRLKPEQTAA